LEVGKSIMLFAPLNCATYCGNSPLHIPSRFMKEVVPGPFGLKTWHAPGGALGAKLFALNTPSSKSAPRTTAMMRIAQP